jgi:putative tricarboxylic transport membrane protein
VGPAGRAVAQTLQAPSSPTECKSTTRRRGGTIGLAQLINNNKGDGNALMVTGKGHGLGDLHQQVAGQLVQCNPDRETERRVRSPGRSDVIELEDDGRPDGDVQGQSGSVSWAGGLAGGVDQLTAGMIIQAVGGDAGKFNYVAFGSGGEVLSQTLGGHVTVGLGGYNEFASQITAGKLRALAITSDKRLPGVSIPTLKEQGINVEFVNWRGLMAAPGITEAQRQELIKTVTSMAKSKEWKSILEKDGWIDLFMPATNSRRTSNRNRRMCSRSSTRSAW